MNQRRNSKTGARNKRTCAGLFNHKFGGKNDFREGSS
jgi:hypothetical protein